jgi:hypothetical protein
VLEHWPMASVKGEKIMREVLKYVSKKYWDDSMGWDEPIYHQGFYYVLLNDETIKFEQKYSHYDSKTNTKYYEMICLDEEKWANKGKTYELVEASEEECKEYLRKKGYVFVGDEVEVIKGRTLPIGSKHTIRKYYEYDIPGTYGHQKVCYLYFTDGTKINIDNVRHSSSQSKYTWFCEYYKNKL